MRSVPGKHYDFKRPARGEPWFTAPVARFIEMIDPFVDGIRTLPDDMLAAEQSRLAVLCGQPDHHLAHRLVHRIFAAETARRSDPAKRFDADLHAALARLAYQTNDADRALVTDIGRKLFDIGGLDAMHDAQRRALAAVSADKQAMHRNIIAKRWAGIGPRRPA